MKRKAIPLYPGTAEAEREASRATWENTRYNPPAPDLLHTAGGIAPNYEKFKSWDPASVLAFLNID